MGKIVYLNSAMKHLRRSQEPLSKLVSSTKIPQIYEWQFYEMAEANGPVLQKLIDGEIVKYNPNTKHVFVNNLFAHTLESVNGIYLALEYGEWYFPYFFYFNFIFLTCFFLNNQYIKANVTVSHLFFSRIKWKKTISYCHFWI